MSCKITSHLNFGRRMFWSIQQCMRSNLKNKNIICREWSSLRKDLKSVLLIKFPHNTLKNRAIYKEPWSLDIFFRRECVVPLGQDFYCSDNSQGKVKENVNDGKTEIKLSLYQRLKKMYKEYWYVLVPVHLITSSFWFGGFYYLAASGIDIPALLESFGAPDSWSEGLKNSKAGNVVLAYTLYKVATPARYTVTLGGTTISINYLKKWGWIKPVPNKAQFKKLYEEQKGALKDLKASYTDKMQVTKSEFLKTKNEMKQHYVEANEELHNAIKGTRNDFKEICKEGADEWKMMGRVLKKNMKKWSSSLKDKK